MTTILIILVVVAIAVMIVMGALLARRGGREIAKEDTGLTMTCTAIVAFGVLFVVSFVEYVPTFYEISGVVLFGLIGDLVTTWLGNASIILLYVKHKKGQ